MANTQTIGGSVGTSGFLEVHQAAVDEREGVKCQAAAGHFITLLRWWKKLSHVKNDFVYADIVLVAQMTTIMNVYLLLD